MNTTRLEQTLSNLSNTNYRALLRYQITMDILRKFIWIGRFDGTNLDGYSIHITNSKQGLIQMVLEQDIKSFGFIYSKQFNNMTDCIDLIKILCEHGVVSQ